MGIIPTAMRIAYPKMAIETKLRAEPLFTVLDNFLENLCESAASAAYMNIKQVSHEKNWV
jgi:hypothetical protein